MVTPRPFSISLGARLPLIWPGLLLASSACGGGVGENPNHAGVVMDGSFGSGDSTGSASVTSGTSTGSSVNASGTSISSGSTSSGGTSGSSSGGTLSCSATQPAGTCSVPGQVCHYYDGTDGTGETDCGCSAGQWQCFSGCSPSTVDSKVDPAVCQPQLASATSCHPFAGACSFTFQIPCWGDAGSSLGQIDAGLEPCSAWGKSVAPPDTAVTPQCKCLDLVDGGPDGGVILIGTCNGCGA